MKVIKQFTCLLVCFVLLSSSFMVGYAADDDLLVSSEYVPEFIPEVSLNNELLYSVAPAADIVPGYEWRPLAGFKFSTAILSGDDFILYDDLPYGLDTIVICCSYESTVLLFFLNGDDSVVSTFTETWQTNGQCRIVLTSMSLIYRIGLNAYSGKAIQFLSYTGLTNDNNSITQIGDEAYYSFAYTFSASDIYVSLTNNSKDMDKFISLNGETQPAIYGTFSYPTRANLNQQLQQEEIQTSKSIWETLKSVWDTLKSTLEYIKHLPSNIANLISEFFTTLGDRISGFFEGLGDRISSFFTTLKNYILYFQAEEPNLNDGWGYSDFLTDLRDYVYEMKKNLTDFNNSLDTTFESIESYITTGSDVINRLLSGVPILNTVLIFFLIFAVVRKAVGR